MFWFSLLSVCSPHKCFFFFYFSVQLLSSNPSVKLLVSAEIIFNFLRTPSLFFEYSFVNTIWLVIHKYNNSSYFLEDKIYIVGLFFYVSIISASSKLYFPGVFLSFILEEFFKNSLSLSTAESTALNTRVDTLGASAGLSAQLHLRVWLRHSLETPCGQYLQVLFLKLDRLWRRLRVLFLEREVQPRSTEG